MPQPEPKAISQRQLRVWQLAVSGLVLVAVLGVLAFRLFLPEGQPFKAYEPVYQGRTLTDWVYRYDLNQTSLPMFTNAIGRDELLPGGPDYENRLMRGRHTEPYQPWTKEQIEAYQTKRRDDLQKVIQQREAAIAQAQSAIQAMGTNALPYLTESLRYEDSSRTKLVDFLGRRTPFLRLMPVAQRMQIASPSMAAEKNFVGALGLKILGPVAEPTIRKALNDPNRRVRETATNLLSKLP